MMRLLPHFRSVLFLATAVFSVAMSGVSTAQDVMINESIEEDLRTLNLPLKVVYYDRYGKKERIKGVLLLATSRSLMVREESNRSSETHIIRASQIIKVKIRGNSDAAEETLTGALSGTLSGGFVPIATGNIGVDLVAGALQGALGGLLNSTNNSRVVRVNRSVDAFNRFLLPEVTDSP